MSSNVSRNSHRSFSGSDRLAEELVPELLDLDERRSVRERPLRLPLPAGFLGSVVSRSASRIASPWTTATTTLPVLARRVCPAATRRAFGEVGLLCSCS